MWRRRQAIRSRNNVDLYTRDCEEFEVLLRRIRIFTSNDKEPIVTEDCRLSDERSRLESHSVFVFSLHKVIQAPKKRYGAEPALQVVLADLQVISNLKIGQRIKTRS